jgi:methylglutaconyl-CoA hydratase
MVAIILVRTAARRVHCLPLRSLRRNSRVSAVAAASHRLGAPPVGSQEPPGYSHRTRSWCSDQPTPNADHDKEASQVLLEHKSSPLDPLVDNRNEHDTRPFISILTLNRPSARNALGRVMLHQLQQHLSELEVSKSRCVLLTSSDPAVFSAGADLKERATLPLEDVAPWVSLVRSTCQRLAALPMPVVAAVEGRALGGGLELLLAADVCVASTTLQCGLPETGWAICPGAGGTQRLPRRVGSARAKELIFTGAVIDAETALRYGVVQCVVPAGTALAEAERMAWRIAAQGPLAVRAAKWAIDQGIAAGTMEAALDIERQAYDRIVATEDRLEGLAAFAEKRPPQYKGR